VKLMPITQILSEYDGVEYSAELLLKHAIDHLRKQNELAAACRWAQTQIGKHTRPSPIDKALELIEGETP